MNFFVLTPHPKPDWLFQNHRILSETPVPQFRPINASHIAGMYVHAHRGVFIASVQTEGDRFQADWINLFKQAQNGTPDQRHRGFNDLADALDHKREGPPGNSDSQHTLVVVAYSALDKETVEALANKLNRSAVNRRSTDRYLFIPRVGGLYMVATREGIGLQADPYTKEAQSPIVLTWKEINNFVGRIKERNAYVISALEWNQLKNYFIFQKAPAVNPPTPPVDERIQPSRSSRPLQTAA